MLQVRNGTLPDGNLVSIQILGSKISGITSEPVETGSLDLDFDARGSWVLPGGIDGHVHDRFPGNPRAEQVPSLVLDALAGGTTTVFKMPNTDPPLTTAESIVANFGLLGDQPIGYYAWLGLLPDTVSEIDAVRELPMVCGGKIYGSRTTGGLFVPERRHKYLLCERAAARRMLVAAHAQDQALIDRNRVRLGRNLTLADHCIVQDAEVETASVREFLDIQRDTQCPLVLCHLSSPRSLELAQDAKQRGAEVYVEVCPQHFARLDSSWLLKPEGWRVKMNPSLRSQAEMLAMRSYVCRRGWVDFAHTDHAPHAADEPGKDKLAAGYDDIPSGMPGVRSRMLVMFDLVADGLMSIEHMVELTSANAARVFGLNGKGKVAVGADADLTAIDPLDDTTMDDRDMHTRCGWTPFNGLIFRGRIRATVAKGKLWVF